MSDYLSPEIACRQVLRKEGTVFSAQWTVFPVDNGTAITPSLLLARYLEHIRRFTLSLVRPRQNAQGIEFRFMGAKLLSFHPPQTLETDQGECLRILLRGGLLLQPQSCGNGELTFRCQAVPGGTRAALELADYCPLLLGGPTPSIWRKLFYRYTQAVLHRLVTVRFLERLHRELAGRQVCCRVVRVRTAGEEDI